MLKVLLKKRRHFFKLFFIYEHLDIFKYIYLHIYIYIYIYIYYIYIKNIAIFYVECTKKLFFSLYSLLHFSFKNSCKMNRDEQGGAGRKFEVLSEHTFWMTAKFLVQLRSYFNLQSNTFLYQLNGFISFSPMENIFPNSFANS